MFTYTHIHDEDSWAEESFETVAEAIQMSFNNAVEHGELGHPMLGVVMTYSVENSEVKESSTAPFVANDGKVCHYLYDHTEGQWLYDTFILGLYTGEKVIELR